MSYRRYSILVVMLTAMACSSGTVIPSTRTPSSAATVDPALDPSRSPAGPTTPPFAGLVDIGAGQELYLVCQGTGTPTILLEAGDESGVTDWRLVMPSLSAETRVCAYERAGINRSDAATGCRGVDEVVGDLEALIDVAAIPGPYVLVGASGGGFLMAELAARRPSEVAGIVFAEVPEAIGHVPPDLAETIKCDSLTNIERRDYVAIEQEVWSRRAELGDFPMTIISDDHGDNVEKQRGWLVLTPNSRQVVVTSGHDVPVNEPNLVIREILDVLEAARSQ